MEDVIRRAGILKMDSATQRLLKEEGWRKAADEEEKAFLGYYLFGRNVKKSIVVIRVIIILGLLVSLGELAFEMLLRYDLSYDIVPMITSVVVCVLLLLFNEVIYVLYRNKAKASVTGNIYVIDAIAMESGTNQVILSVNNHIWDNEKFMFDEAAGQMDYVYDEKGNNKGFRVLLYTVIKDGKCERKVVLGSHSYRFFIDKYNKAYK